MDFTFKYFCSEVANFRDLFGTRTFMADEEKQAAAIKGLSYVYLNTKTENEEETRWLGEIFVSTMHEYNMRKTLLATHPKFH